MDRRTGFHTRCSLTVPLVDHAGSLVGAMQLLNQESGAFSNADVALAQALAAQCAVALQRAQMTGALIEGEKMRRELEMGRMVQQSTLPSAMPLVQGYDVYGTSVAADLTGGDTFDVAVLDSGILLVLGDATGHGLAPALHVTQMHAMLRMAMRLGADLDTTCLHLNNQLAETLPDDRFITAFIGLLDTSTHRVRYHSAGQAPLLQFSAAGDAWQTYKPTGFPLAAMSMPAAKVSRTMELGEGDILALLSDGVFECHDPRGEMFGEARTREIIRANYFRPLQQASDALLAAVRLFGEGAPQEDDITVLLVRRRLPSETRSFARTYESLTDLVAFVESAFVANGIDPALRMAIDFTVEELFTNMVKYSTMSQSPIDMEIGGFAGGVHVTLTDRHVDRFDVTEAPDVDVHRPIEERRPGGLGLHLIRRMVDSIEYEYDPASRVSRTRFSKLKPVP